MQEASIRTRDSLKNRQTELTDQIQRLEVKNTEIEYKIAQALKQVEVHSQMLQQVTQLQGAAAADGALVPVANGGQGGNRSMSVEHATQVAFLRDQLNEEHQKREQAQQEFQRG